MIILVKRLMIRALRGANVVFIAICALIVIAAYLPGIPYMGPAGSIFVPLFGPWFIILPLVIESLVLWRSAARNRQMARVLFAVSVFITIGSSVVIARIIHIAHSNSVNVSALDLFRLHTTATGPDATITYDNNETGPLLMAVYRPRQTEGEHAAPILIDVHGGGWIMGTMLDHETELRWFADHGWLVFSPNYTLSTSALHKWNTTTSQIGCAMSWVAANSAKFGGDAALLSMFGDSAGGNLAINAAFMANQGSLRSDCGGSIPRVRSVLATYPVVDPAAFYNNNDPLMAAASRMMAGEYTGGTPRQFPERYAAISSAATLNRDAPPTLIFVGESDHLVPPESTYQFVDRAKVSGIEMHLIRVPYADHGFDAVIGSIGNQIVRGATLDFLRTHGQSPAQLRRTLF
jgi:acetyl esterase